MDPETRTYLDEMRRDFHGLRDEVRGLRDEVERLRPLPDAVQDLRGEMHQVRIEMDQVRIEMRATAEATRRHFDIVGEALRHEIRTVAEGVVANTEAIVRFRSEIDQDMDRRFDVVRLAFVDVRRDIEDLRTRL